MVFYNNNVCLCKHPEKNSSLLLIVASSGMCIRMYFSFRHNLQQLELALKAWFLDRILHLISGSNPSSFRDQTYPANLVLILLWEYLKLVLWFPYRSF